jgi:hypothetical protein
MNFEPRSEFHWQLELDEFSSEIRLLKERNEKLEKVAQAAYLITAPSCPNPTGCCCSHCNLIQSLADLEKS